MKDMDFVKPKNSAKNKRHIGLIIADITEDYSISVIKAVEHQCRLLGYSVLVCDSEDDEDTEHQNITKLLDNERIGGIIISPVNAGKCDPRLENTLIPVVSFDRKYTDSNVMFFGINNLQTGYNATKYLCAHGCKNVGFIGYPKEVYSVHQREAGYRVCWQEQHEDAIPHVLKLHYFQEDSITQIENFIQSKKVDGLICATSSVCHQVITAIEALSLSIPHDIKLVSYDDTRWFDFLRYPVSVITQPVTQIGQGCVNKIVEKIENPDLSSDETSEIYFETGFVDRLKK